MLNRTKSQDQSTDGSDFIRDGACNEQITYGSYTGNEKTVISMKSINNVFHKLDKHVCSCMQ